jgi:hypothetical protein
MTRKNRSVIESAGEVDLLASPARQEIADTLEALGGEASVAAIAAQLGRPMDGLYYHLRLLVDGGLLVELPDAGEGRRYRTRSAGGARLRLRYHPGRTRNARAVKRVTAGMLRIAARDFAAALADPAVVVEGRERALWASRTKGWARPSELAEINELLQRLSALLRRGDRPKGGKLMSLTWVLAPTVARPPRRGPG